MILPERPSPPGGSGSFYLATGVEYTLSEESKNAVESALRTYPAHVKRNIRLESRLLAATAIAVSTEPSSETLPGAAIQNPRRPPKAVAEGDSGTPEINLTSDDGELVQVEVAKLYDKTIAEGTPLIERTAGNEELPIEMRRAYLSAVIEDGELQKGLKDRAQEWLDLLNS